MLSDKLVRERSFGGIRNEASSLLGIWRFNVGRDDFCGHGNFYL